MLQGCFAGSMLRSGAVHAGLGPKEEDDVLTAWPYAVTGWEGRQTRPTASECLSERPLYCAALGTIPVRTVKPPYLQLSRIRY